jgi:hypothetical protein
MVTFRELATFTSMRDWRLTGRDAVVKVVSTEDSDLARRTKTVWGYVTQAKFLAGKNAFQIERDLGLRPESLRRGAFVLYFLRLPTLAEVEQRYTADFPDGTPWTPEKQTEFDLARDAYYKNPYATQIEYYPPGSSRVMQWELLSPVPLSGKASQVTTSTTFNLL